jgi:dolichol-phosphate mannosyltransferase
MEAENIALVIPTYNERENIIRLVEAINDTCRRHGLNPEILVVDDGSPDGTADAAEEMNDRFRVKVIRRKGRRGLGLSYHEGFQTVLNVSPAEFIFSMDADFSHDPEAIPLLLQKVRGEGWDLAVGSRYIPGGSIPEWGAARRIISASCNALSRLLLGLSIRDVTTGFRCYRRHVLEALPWKVIRCEGYAFMEEILFYCEKLGFTIGEAPITYRERTWGETKLNALEIAKVFFTLLRLRFTRENVKRGKFPQKNT